MYHISYGLIISDIHTPTQYPNQAAPAKKAKARKPKWDKNDPRGKRPSPNQSAAETDVGTVMRGNDGTDYIVTSSTKGVHRWVKHKP